MSTTTTSKIRRFLTAAMRRLQVRPPKGHMAMLRDVVDQRESDRVAQAAATDERQARASAARASEE